MIPLEVFSCHSKYVFPLSMNYSYVLTHSGLTSKTLGRKATKIEGYLLTWMVG